MLTCIAIRRTSWLFHNGQISQTAKSASMDHSNLPQSMAERQETESPGLIGTCHKNVNTSSTIMDHHPTHNQSAPAMSTANSMQSVTTSPSLTDQMLRPKRSSPCFFFQNTNTCWVSDPISQPIDQWRCHSGHWLPLHWLTLIIDWHEPNKQDITAEGLPNPATGFVTFLGFTWSNASLQSWILDPTVGVSFLEKALQASLAVNCLLCCNA